jgi:archaellum component FlaG (FlaF/FlaG flagellin family)
VPFLLNSSLDVSVFSVSPTPGTSILTRGRQTVVIISAPTEVPANDTTTSDLVFFVKNKITSPTLLFR